MNRYSSVAITLHWVTAAVLAIEIGLGWRNVAQPASLPGVHESLGILILLLTVARIAWRLSARNVPSPLADTPWEAMLARAVHVAFYGLLIAIPLSGWLMASVGEDKTLHLFGLLPWPALPGVAGRETLGNGAEVTHRTLNYLLYVLIALHVAGALKHHIIHGPAWLARILPGLRQAFDWRLGGIFILAGVALSLAAGFADAILPGPLRQWMTPRPLPATIDGRRAALFTAFVQPALGDKCGSCHGSARQKGGLRLDTLDGILEGGDDGTVVVASNAEQSELVRRILLPPDHEDVMPPRGKPQLSAAEGAILVWWIESGANDRLTILGANLPPILQAALRARGVISESAVFSKNVEPASPASLSAARDAGFKVRPILRDAAFLYVRLSDPINRPSPDTGALAAIGEQLVWLDVAGSGITDADVRGLHQLKRLQRLNLARTGTTDTGLKDLAGLAGLEVLNLYGTRVSDASVQVLTKMPALLSVYLGGTAVTQRGIEQLRQARPALRIVWEEHDPYANAGEMKR